jgi:hypothetical protein
VTDEGSRRQARLQHDARHWTQARPHNFERLWRRHRAPFGATPHPSPLRGDTFPRKGGRGARASAVCVCAALLAVAAPAFAKPQRVVSINMCMDELVLRLADRDAIASVTWLSQDPRNANMAEAAKGLPANNGLAEEALSFHPDLVLAGPFTERFAKSRPFLASRSAARRWSPTSIGGWRGFPSTRTVRRSRRSSCGRTASPSGRDRWSTRFCAAPE